MRRSDWGQVVRAAKSPITLKFNEKDNSLLQYLWADWHEWGTLGLSGVTDGNYADQWCISRQSVVWEILFFSSSPHPPPPPPLRKCLKCTYSSGRCPSVFPNDPTIPYSCQTFHSLWSGEFISAYNPKEVPIKIFPPKKSIKSKNVPDRLFQT